jgi:hypothetical protein
MKYLLKIPGIHMKIPMRYPGEYNEISIENARHPYENPNETPWEIE